MVRSPRVESDFLGAVEVPGDVLYGAHTVRAQRNSGLGGLRLAAAPTLLASLARTKVACARANGDLGSVPAGLAEAIVRAGRDVAAGRHDAQFPLEILQGGGGTALNMNVNEVLANLANRALGHPVGGYRPVHPHDHVNRSQSTNDVFPTAMAIATFEAVRGTVAALEHLADALDDLAGRHPDLEHLGRTCLQDAVPVRVADFHTAHAFAVRRAVGELRDTGQALLAVPLGATAVGTGLGADPRFGELAVRHLAIETGHAMTRSDNPFDALASLAPFSAVADALARAARAVARVAGDVRLLASGPVGGFGEIVLPAVQAGSSIMPGKVNPVLPELVIQAQFLLAGTAHSIAMASATPELHVTPQGPVVMAELLRGTHILARAAELFAERCLRGLTWQADRVAANLAGSYEQAVAHAARHGYAAAARP